MIKHVFITVSDLRRAEGFYDAAIYKTKQSVGYGIRNSSEDNRHSYLSVLADGGVVADCRNWVFRTPSRTTVDRFYAAALAAGGRDDVSPGLWPQYNPSYYAAFVTDFDGNRIEAVCQS